VSGAPLFISSTRLIGERHQVRRGGPIIGKPSLVPAQREN
jgi:hypothetical protein